MKFLCQYFGLLGRTDNMTSSDEIVWKKTKCLMRNNNNNNNNNNNTVESR